MPLPSFTVQYPSRSRRITVIEVRPKGPADIPGSPAAAWLIMERTEVREIASDGSLVEAQLSLDYERLDAPHIRSFRGGRFDACYARAGASGRPAASITAGSLGTGGYVTLDLAELEGHRVGSYLMEQVIEWVQQWPDADLRQVRLMHGNASRDESRDRRNRFYEQFGIRFRYEDVKHEVGVALPMKCVDLCLPRKWEGKVIEHDPIAWTTKLLEHQHLLRLELAAVRRDRQLLEERLLRASSYPLLRAVSALWRRFTS